MKTTQRETQKHLMNQDGIKKMSNWPTGRQEKRETKPEQTENKK